MNEQTPSARSAGGEQPMTPHDIHEAFMADEEIEYHLMGNEENASLLPGPGWYPVIIDMIHLNGDVEIVFLSAGLDTFGARVLAKNIPIAFRKKHPETLDNRKP